MTVVSQTREEGTRGPGQARAIIRRKLLPPPLADRLVPRERLTLRILSMLEHSPVLAVAATAGSGKTTAVALALRDITRPVAWLSLDGTESAAGRLLVYLEAAVEASVPEAHQVATDALSAGIPIGEAAGLFAESLHGSDLVLVLDNVERILSSEQSVAVLSAVARYLPEGVNLLLLSRTAVSLDPGSTGERGRLCQLGETDLAFDLEEAGAALRLVGHPDIDVEQAVRATGGWVTGVLFEGWRAQPPPGQSTSTESLFDYLETHILTGLTAAERHFLTHSSVLPEITTEGAVALGLLDAAAIMASLRARHLPVAWSPDGTRLTPHPRFREHLAQLLDREDPEGQARLRRRYASLLLDRGEREEAVDVLLRLGDTDAAWQAAASALPTLVDRMDFAPAARWLDALNATDRTPTPQTAAVILRVAFALEQPGRGVEILDRHGRGWLSELAATGTTESDEALVLAIWCLWHVGRLAEAGEIAGELAPGRPREIALTLLALSRDEVPPAFPDFSTAPSGPLDSMLMRIAYSRGRLEGLDEPGARGPWRTVLGAPWVVAGLRATGRIEQAMAMYEFRRDATQPLWLHAFDAVDLMLDLGRGEDAWRALERGRARVAETGSQVYDVLVLLTEAKLCLRLSRDPEAAERALAQAEARGAAGHAFIRELAELWTGLALLLRGRDAAARDVLRRCVDGMQRGNRRLELATAAAYLAEAEWRTGDEDSSDASAALALAVATEQGSQHLLLTALTDVPAVASRSADAEPTRMSPWHEITALLSDQAVIQVPGHSPRLVFEEFGEPQLLVDGRPAQPRLSKSLELLAFLIDAPDRQATRQELLDGLFAGRNDAAGRSYLRQALYRLREVLPEELTPTQSGDRYRLPGPDLVNGTAQTVLGWLAEAGRQDGEIRLRTLTRALARTERGPFLAPLSSPWVDARREEIEERITTAQLDRGRVALSLGRYREARDAVEAALRRDPYREQGWRLSLSLAQASGNDDAVLALYQRYVATMRDLGVPPSAEVHRLVTRLRR